jgi:uncharacterized membrane protein
MHCDDDVGPDSTTLSASLDRNIAAMSERRKRQADQATTEEKIANAITVFAGSMRFVYLHVALYGGWVAINLGFVPGVSTFDPSFVMLAMVASVEAIFLSTFILISQNQMAARESLRADLDLQISLLAEHEITKLSSLLLRIADKVGVDPTASPDVREVQKDIAPEAVLDELEARNAKPR